MKPTPDESLTSTGQNAVPPRTGRNAPPFQQQAYDYVRAQLLDLSLKPGEWITDSRIAAELSISRTPVREAFRRLESEGLLVSQPRRGWRVHELTLADIGEIFELKEVLEGVVMERAAACRDEELRRRLRRHLAKMQRAGREGDYPAWLAADIALHEVIFEMYPNSRARRLVEQLNRQWQRVRVGLMAMEGRMALATAQHEQLVERILAGDGRGAREQMAGNLRDLRKALEEILVNMVFPFTDNHL